MVLSDDDIATIRHARRDESVWYVTRYVLMITGMSLIVVPNLLSEYFRMGYGVLAGYAIYGLNIIGAIIIGATIRGWTNKQRQLLIRLGDTFRDDAV